MSNNLCRFDFRNYDGMKSEPTVEWAKGYSHDRMMPLSQFIAKIINAQIVEQINLHRKIGHTGGNILQPQPNCGLPATMTNLFFGQYVAQRRQHHSHTSSHTTSKLFLFVNRQHRYSRFSNASARAINSSREGRPMNAPVAAFK